jgi:serine/threonine-protein kinase
LLGRVVALKILTHLEPAAMVRFMHEAQLQARLEHPNICRIYDIDVISGIPRISMQLVKGPTLEDASPDLELTEIVTIIAVVAETLRDAHRSGLIHRDIKPGNIILEWAEEGGWKPILCDFGLALAVNESSLTQPNALTGTPAYMAPEQVRGDRRLVGPATDVYGLGGTLYFLLVGRPPCITTVTQEMLRVKRERRFPSPRALEPSIPEELEAILLRCLAPDLADRYPSMDDLARDLWAFLGKAPAQPAAGPGRKRRLAAAIAVGLATVGLAGLAWRQVSARVRWAEVASQATQEAGNLEQGLVSEKAQPVHDTRKALARIRATKETIRQMYGAKGEGPRNLILGTADLCLEDFPAARAELERAWSAGLTTPENAFQLGLACAGAWNALAQEAAFQGEPPPGPLRREAATWFQRAKGLSRDREEFAQALVAAMGEDLTSAVAHARASQEANPWRREATALGSLCLARLAREALATGDRVRAAQLYLEALGWAEEGVHQAQSDGGLHHAALTAGLGLANLALQRGELQVSALDQLAVRAEQALELNPDGAVAQGDWLSVQCLKAMRLADLGRDPQDTLQAALAFYWTRTREPRPPHLREAHMVLYWLVATRASAQGQPPDAPLAEALKGAGHTTAGPRDYLEDLLHFKASLDASRTPHARPNVRATNSLPVPPSVLPLG